MRVTASTLTLLVTRIRTDHTHNAVAPNNLAVAADALYRCQHFHGLLLKSRHPAQPAFCQKHNYVEILNSYFARKTIRARLRSYGVSCTVTLSPGRMRM